MSSPSSYESVSLWRTLSAALLIAGSVIGGGMLALPVETAAAGFFPSIFVMTLAYLFMLSTGFLIIEVTLWLKDGAHFMTMSSELLGKIGRLVTVLVYLFMGYASLIAYISAGSSLIENALSYLLSLSLNKVESGAIFSIIFGSMLYLGTKSIGKINNWLMAGIVVSYLVLISLGFQKINISYFQRTDWSRSFFSFPLLLAVFSYQMMVPSLTPFLKRDPKALKSAIWIGLTIPFVVYLIWEWLVIGSVPFDGKFGLMHALKLGQTATDSLQHYVGSSYLSLAAQFFAFFALVTSFLGIGLGLKDFLADIFNLREGAFNQFMMGALTVIPSFIFGVNYPKAFLTGLEVSGGFGDTLLSALIPVSMVWVGRYVKRFEGPFETPGGKLLLVSISLIAIAIIILQIVKLLPSNFL